MAELSKTPAAPVWLLRLRIHGFRSYGTEVREINTDSPITLISAENSQGKTATAEAFEFLVSGQISRRSMFGGAKSEYDRVLTNVHLDPVEDVWVEGDFRYGDGSVRTVRRSLLKDFDQSKDCESRITIDGESVETFDAFGSLLSPQPMQAPVLLQHNLRYALSTEPQKRAEYFSAVLSLDDLKVASTALREAKQHLENLPTLELPSTLRELANIAPELAPDVKVALKSKTKDSLRKAMHQTTISFLGVATENLDDSLATLAERKRKAEEDVFPLRSISLPVEELTELPSVDTYSAAATEYETRLAESGESTAELATLFQALVHNERYSGISKPTICPVCEDGRLTVSRIDEIKASLKGQSELNEASENLATDIRALERDIRAYSNAWSGIAPDCLNWSDEQWEANENRLRELLSGSQHSVSLLGTNGVRERFQSFKSLLKSLRTECKDMLTRAEDLLVLVAARKQLGRSLSDDLLKVRAVAEKLAAMCAESEGVVSRLRDELGDKLLAVKLPGGTRELLRLGANVDMLWSQLSCEARRTDAKRRLSKVSRTLSSAEKSLIDRRFDQMGAEIERWWSSLRPSELIGFGGVERRASGRRFVNLSATMSPAEGEAPEERSAIGVFSDSQLNALGLSAFLARQVLAGIPIVMLDDPLPGFDPDHTETFADLTLGQLIDSEIQVILLTHNPKLQVAVRERYAHMGIQHYRLSLTEPCEGTETTDEGDVFGNYMATAQDLIGSRTLGGRKNASLHLRCAAERLAKQIIATNRTEDGAPTRVSEVREKTLGELENEVRPYALSPDEPGRWRRWKSLLNPGNHDNDVPSSADLKVVFGDLRKLRKNHEKHWPNGLLT
ncbi:AAA family ATPase [Arcanobacterium hippocoleae]|uniref:DNA repair exonuclease SbcCD ATPase subunit n=1 Tax=Arcanobacterium hippocoleae TaxID=149017 RepID=A0ABU1T210_9ACTO|nr:AAA family ATPase [Arcanobacterium hippocoleae]MDR6939412.1 DNA repair exonuclease SbcCD ATPase subunit [Arcanobacterium hippocoleae]